MAVDTATEALDKYADFEIQKMQAVVLDERGRERSLDEIIRMATEERGRAAPTPGQQVKHEPVE